MVINDYKDGWDCRVNFTDSNDVFVGYDLEQDCCEDAGWFISKDCCEGYDYNGNECSASDKSILDGYVFDTSYFKNVPSDDLEDGNQVSFRLTCDGRPDLFLHLYNSHNGYYSHGFKAKVGGVTWKDDCL